LPNNLARIDISFWESIWISVLLSTEKSSLCAYESTKKTYATIVLQIMFLGDGS
jgi:hypothetical protein